MTVAAGASLRGVVDPVLEAFAGLVGPSGPVAVAGGRTQWSVGGPGAPGARGSSRRRRGWWPTSPPR